MAKDDKGKSLRLKFKGDSDPRKRHKKHHHHRHSSSKKARSGDESDAEQYGGDEQAWVPVHEPTDLHGPAYLFTTFEGKRFALGLDQMKRVSLIPAASVNAAEAEALLAGTDSAEASVTSIDPSPSSVYEVWVASRVAGSESWNFRSAESQFLSCSASGVLTAQAASRGPLENWSVVSVGDESDGAVSVALQSAQGQWLSASFEDGKPSVRATPDLPDATAWGVRVQWKHRHFARMEQAKAKRTHVPQPNQVGTVLSYGEASGTGKYRSAEQAVDERAKKKSDKYAK